MLFKITDYNIYSDRIYKGTAFTFAFSLCILTLAEIFNDLKSTTIELLLPFTIAGIAIAILSASYTNNKFFRYILIALTLLIIEVHFIVKPTIFHAIIYWFPFVPLIALIIQGIRSALIWLTVTLICLCFDYYYLNTTIGNNYTLAVYSTPFFLTAIVFILSNISFSFLLYKLLGDAYEEMKEKKSELEILSSNIEHKNNVLIKYQQNLLDLSQLTFSNNLENQFENICKTASDALNISRVSVWLFENNSSLLTRKFQFDRNEQQEPISSIETKDFPNYFDTIAKKKIIIAPDVQKHVAVNEFYEPYFKPLNIKSSLDCSIIIDGVIYGIICCEHQFDRKDFNIEDALFVQSLSEFIALSLKNEQIKSLLYEIQKKNGELKNMNNSLEEAVKERTRELEMQNEQLSEYAFINSHLLRAPLSRILGLAFLISHEVTIPEDQKIIQELIVSSNELDAIIKKISEILYDGNNLKREDIRTILDRNFKNSSN